jgi:hypothetical protein
VLIALVKKDADELLDSGPAVELSVTQALAGVVNVFLLDERPRHSISDDGSCLARSDGLML